MKTETNDFIGEEYMTGFDQFDGSIEHALSLESQEQEIFEFSGDTHETTEAPEPAEFIEPGKQAVIDQKGGETHDWKLEYRGDSGYSFDGEQARDPEGNVWVNEDIALHQEMLAQWKDGGSAVFFLPDHKEQTEDGEILYITMLMLDENGKITYEIYNHETRYQKEEDDVLPKVKEEYVDTYALPWLETSEYSFETLAPESIDAPLSGEHIHGSIADHSDSADLISHEPFSHTHAPVVVEGVSMGAVIEDRRTTQDKNEVEEPGASQNIVVAGREHSDESILDAETSVEATLDNAMPEIPAIDDESSERETSLSLLLRDLFNADLISHEPFSHTHAPVVVEGEKHRVPHAETPERHNASSVVEAPPVAASSHEIIDDGGDGVSVSVDIVGSTKDGTPSIEKTSVEIYSLESKVISDGLPIDTHIEQSETSSLESAHNQPITPKRESQYSPSVLEDIDQSSMKHRHDEAKQRTPLQGSEVLLRALGIRAPSPHLIDHAHESVNPEIIRVTHSKSPHHSPPRVRSASRVISKLNGITMRRTT